MQLTVTKLLVHRLLSNINYQKLNIMTTQETNKNEKKQVHFISFSDNKRNQWNRYRRYAS